MKVDIDRVYQDNLKKEGFRKFNTILINTGDKLTREQKIALCKENKIKYGLSEEYVNSLKLPNSSHVRIFDDVKKIMSGKKLFTIPEKLEHLFELKNALHERLKIIKKGATIKNFENLKYEDFKNEKLKLENPELHYSQVSYQGSDLDEINEDGEVIRAVEMKNEMDDILQRRSSAISSNHHLSV